MNYIKIFYTSFLILTSTTMALFADPLSQEEKQESVIKSLEISFDQARDLVQSLSQDNVNVLTQYNEFATTLMQSYVSGEGFIDKDVFKILNGIIFAAKKHQFQVRKDPNQTPYIIHPMGVANHLMVIGKVRDSDIIIGALLHDTVEDTDTTFDEIYELFGPRVTNFVREVTDDKSLPKQTRKNLQIAHAPKKSAGAAQIKLADKLYNLSDLLTSPPLDWEKERVDAYFVWAKTVVDQLPWVNAPLKHSIDKVVEAYWNDNTQT